MRDAITRRRDDDAVIDAEFTLIEPPKKHVSLAGIAVCVVAILFVGGALFGVWSGDTAISALAVLAAVAGCVAFGARSPRRISGIYRAGMLMGLAGIGLVALAPVGWLVAIGGIMALMAWLVLCALDNRGWRYDH